MTAPQEAKESLAQAIYLAHTDCMAGGWLVSLCREGRGIRDRELWYCAIENCAEAQLTVRHASMPGKVVMRVHDQLSSDQLAVLGLKVGQIRKQ